MALSRGVCGAAARTLRSLGGGRAPRASAAAAGMGPVSPAAPVVRSLPGGLEVAQVPVLGDNYAFLIRDAESGAVALVDTPDAQPIENAVKGLGWGAVTHILNTHHHHDHTGGNLELKRAHPGAVVIGAEADRARLPGLDVGVKEGDRVEVGSAVATVIETPGHTRAHVCYHFGDSGAVFVGDTLFAMGCGRLFEGSPAQMHASLAKLAALPDDTLVFCAHEYTQTNARFSLTVEPDNAALVSRAAEVDAARARGEPTVPTNIGLEKATNPFVRAASVDAFATVRKAKDNF